MKIFLILSSLAFSSLAMADQSCTALAKYVGSYKQISKSCDSFWFGPSLTVTPFTETRSPRYSGFWITSGPGGFGPTTLADGTDLDQCIARGNDVVVQICGNAKDRSCLPAKDSISYIFSGSQVTFSADQCTAVYVRE